VEQELEKRGMNPTHYHESNGGADVIWNLLFSCTGKRGYVGVGGCQTVPGHFEVGNPDSLY